MRDDFGVESGLDQVRLLHRQVSGFVPASQPLNQVADGEDLRRRRDIFLAATVIAQCGRAQT